MLIEYLAKPRLEVRKDRILEADRKRRAYLDDLHHCIRTAQQMAIVAPTVGEEWDDRAIELAKDLDTRIQPVWDGLHLGDLEDPWTTTTAEMAAVAFTISVDGPTPDDCAELDDYASRLLVFELLLRTRKVRWRRRQKIRRAILERDRQSGAVKSAESQASS